MPKINPLDSWMIDSLASSTFNNNTRQEHTLLFKVKGFDEVFFYACGKNSYDEWDWAMAQFDSSGELDVDDGGVWTQEATSSSWAFVESVAARFGQDAVIERVYFLDTEKYGFNNLSRNQTELVKSALKQFTSTPTITSNPSTERMVDVPSAQQITSLAQTAFNSATRSSQSKTQTISRHT